MAYVYRVSRNIEASIIQYIEEQLALAWSNYNVEKTFANVRGIPVNKDTKNFVVCVRLSDTDHSKIELGSSSTRRLPLIIIDLYCANDGQRLDVKDYLVDKLKGGCTYYLCETASGAFDSKTADGRIDIKITDDNIVDIDIDKDKLDGWDRFRHRLVLTVSTGKVEI